MCIKITKAMNRLGLYIIKLFLKIRTICYIYYLKVDLKVRKASSFNK